VTGAGVERDPVGRDDEPREVGEQGHHPLPVVAARQYPVDEVGGRVRHAPARARRAEPAGLAAEGDQAVLAAVPAVQAQAASLEDPAPQELFQLPVHVLGQRPPEGILTEVYDPAMGTWSVATSRLHEARITTIVRIDDVDPGWGSGQDPGTSTEDPCQPKRQVAPPARRGDRRVRARIAVRGMFTDRPQ
jgi:hypothetical protein